MFRIRPTLRADLTWSLRKSLFVALALSVLVAVRDGAIASAGAPRAGFSTETVVLFYMVCGLIVGVVVGVFRPRLGSFVTRAAVAVLASWPCIFLLENLTNNAREDLWQRATDASVLAVLAGIISAIVFSRGSKEP